MRATGIVRSANLYVQDARRNRSVDGQSEFDAARFETVADERILRDTLLQSPIDAFSR